MRDFSSKSYRSADQRTTRDGASLAVFRFLFGAILCVGAIRFLALGWVETVFEKPQFFFKYPGFEWIEPWPSPFMHVHYSVLAFLALCIAVGLFYRAAVALFGLGFAYAQLIDLTNYLNHYYLVCLLCFLMAFMPLNRVWSIDRWLSKKYGALR